MKHWVIERSIQRYTNIERRRKGLKPLKGHRALIRAARKHSVWMAKTGRYSHKGAGGSQPYHRAVAAGFRGSATGENIWNTQGEPWSSMEEQVSLAWRLAVGEGGSHLLAKQPWAPTEPALSGVELLGNGGGNQSQGKDLSNSGFWQGDHRRAELAFGYTVSVGLGPRRTLHRRRARHWSTLFNSRLTLYLPPNYLP